jgi:hypothetical protein
VGDFWRDENRAEFVCTVGGTPGTWRQTAPASGTFPTGYLILNLTEEASNATRGPCRGRFRWAPGTSSKVGFHRAAPTAQRASANQVTATDLAGVITLANELRAALVEKGLIQGGP